MIRVSQGFYRFVRIPATVVMRFLHPIVRISGRENLPEGPCVLCGNHRALTDPIWIVLAGRFRRVPRTMAKKELIDTPVIGSLVQVVGAFPVDRDHNDIGAIKTALRVLRDGDKLMIFPEGTRVRRGKVSQPHSGAMLIASRAGVPVIPVYTSLNRRFWAPLEVSFGKPIFPNPDGRKLTQEELDDKTAEMMKTIYAMGQTR